jgi:hypothetical protein
MKHAFKPSLSLSLIVVISLSGCAISSRYFHSSPSVDGYKRNASLGDEDLLVSIDFMKKKSNAPSSLFGVNTLFWIETAEEHADGIIPRYLKDAGITTLRYPAGTASQNYDWENNRLYDPDEWPIRRQGVTFLDTEGFIRLLHKTSASPFIVIDLTSVRKKVPLQAIGNHKGDDSVYDPLIQKAVRWVSYFRSRGIHVQCYELGNEHYLGTPEDFTHLDAQAYADIALRFAKAIKAADPDASLGIHGESAFPGEGAWWPIVLGKVYAYVDHIILHQYYHGSAETDLYTEKTVSNYGNEVAHFRVKLREFLKSRRLPLKNYKIGYTEWGSQGISDPTEYALFLHEALTGFLRNGVDFALLWPLRRSLEWEKAAPELVKTKDDKSQPYLFNYKSPTAAYYVFKNLADYTIGKMHLPIDEERTKLPPQIYGPVVTDGDAIYWLPANKGTEPGTLGIAIKNKTIKTVEVNFFDQTAHTFKRLNTQTYSDGMKITIPAKTFALIIAR